jgi:hypothetical protein
MQELQFLCLAVGRRDGGNCLAGIDLDSGKWIRPVNAKTHGAFADHEIIVVDGGTQKHRILTPLDVLRIRLDRYVGSNVQPENWEMAPAPHGDAYMVLRRFDSPQDANILISYLDQNGPLLHSYSDRFSFDDLFSKRRLSHSLSIIKPEQLHWRVGPHPTYANKMRVQAEFRFDDDPYPYCLVVTDSIWEIQCKRFGLGRHPHSMVAGNAHSQVLLTISLAEKPLNGFHYKLVAGVVNLTS